MSNAPDDPDRPAGEPQGEPAGDPPHAESPQEPAWETPVPPPPPEQTWHAPPPPPAPSPYAQPGHPGPYPAQQPYGQPTYGHPAGPPGQHPPVAPGYAPSNGQGVPMPQRPGLSFGAKLAIGLGIGFAAHLLGVFAMLATMNALSDLGFLAAVWPFVLIALATIVMMFFPRTRPFATGMLILAATLWLVIIGPCVVILFSL